MKKNLPLLAASCLACAFAGAQSTAVAPAALTASAPVRLAPVIVASEAMLDAFDRAGAFRLLDENSRDSALGLSLAPGSYTVQVKSGDGSVGAALLEVYDLP